MAETVYTNIGAKYYLHFVSITIPSWYKYRSLPLNSTFNVDSDFHVRLVDVLGNRQDIIAADLTFSGYNMSTTGFQEITVSYTAPNGQVLTDTFTLHVYGATTWRTIWSGSENIKLERKNNVYQFIINDVERGGTGFEKAITITANEPVIRKYIGYEGSRRLRLTCTLNKTTNTNLFTVGNISRSIDSSSHTYIFNYNLNNQVNTGGHPTYQDVIDGNTLIVINTKEFVGNRYQALFATLSDNITPGSNKDSILNLQVVSETYHQLYGNIPYEFTITKIEVLE